MHIQISPRLLAHWVSALMVLIASGSARAQGSPGRSLDVGTGVRVRVPIPQPESFTVEAWVKPTRDFFPGSFTIAGFGAYRNDARLLAPFLAAERVSGTGLAAYAIGPMISASDEVGPVVRGQWVHLALVYERAASGRAVTRLYVDGQLAQQGDALVTLPSAGGDLYIGGAPDAPGAGHPSFNLPWRGLVDEVIVWDRARDRGTTQGQIRRDRIAGLPTPGSEPGLLAYLTFDEPGGNLLINAAPGQPGGTIENPAGGPMPLGIRVDENAPLGQTGPADPLAGTYAVPGDFATPQAAADAVSARGLVGPVTFVVAPGTYALSRPFRVTVGEAAEVRNPNGTVFSSTDGTTRTRRVTFRSPNGRAADVVFERASAGSEDNAVVEVAGADFVTFEGITFRKTGGEARVAHVLRGSRNPVFEACAFDGGRNSAVTSTGLPDALVLVDRSDEVLVRASTLRRGGVGVYLLGTSSGNAVEKSEITDVGAGVSAFAQRDLRLVGNRIAATRSTGVHLTAAGTYTIEANRITSESDGLNVDYFGSSGARGPNRLVNNVLASRTNLGFSSSALYELDAAHNTFVGGRSAAAQISGRANGSVRFRNNLFAVESDQPALRAFSLQDVVGTDNAFSAAGNEVVIGHFTAADWDAASGWTGSIEAWPGFTNPTAGDYTLRSSVLTGPVLADVPFDVDGRERIGSRTGLGAHRETGGLAPLAGDIAVGSALQDALDALALRGISAVTRLVLTPGAVYPSAYTLRPVPGATGETTVEVTTAPGRTATLSREAAGATDNYLLRLVRPQNVRVTGLTFLPQGTQFQRAVVLLGHVRNVDLRGAYVALAQPTATSNGALVFGERLSGAGLLIGWGVARGGGYAVSIEGLTDPMGAPFLSGVVVERLEAVQRGFAGRGVSLRQTLGPVVRLNTLDAAGIALELINTRGGADVSQNGLRGGSMGLFLSEAIGTETAPVRVVNNAVTGTGPSALGVFVRDSDEVRFFHNAVEMRGGGNSVAFDVSRGAGPSDGLVVRNNAFANADGGLVYRLATGAMSAGAQFGPNALHTSGTVLAGQLGGASASTLAEVRALLTGLSATGTPEAGSLAIDPAFSPGYRYGLTPTAAALYGAGATVGVGGDFGGGGRPLPSGTAPDLGPIERDQGAGFAVAGPPSLEVPRGQARTVNWATVNLAGDVRIALLIPGETSGGAPGRSPGDVMGAQSSNRDAGAFAVELAVVAAASRSWTWTPDAALPLGGGYRLVVAPVGRPADADTSAAFALVAGTPVQAGEGDPLPAVSLEPPAPNPARGHLRIRFALPAPSGRVTVEVFDALGRRVALLTDGARAAGSHDVALDASPLAPGVYAVRLTTGQETLRRPFVILR